MLKNYMKTTWRNIWRNKTYTAINVVGLSIGLSVFLLVLLYVNRAQSYDRWDDRLEHLYRVGVTERNEGNIEKSPSSPFWVCLD